jgi:hypothetical protein
LSSSSDCSCWQNWGCAHSGSLSRASPGPTCDHRWVSQLQVRSLAERAGRKVGLSAIDPVLGYVPAPGFDDVLQSYEWRSKRVTIGPEGFRDNG